MIMQLTKNDKESVSNMAQQTVDEREAQLPEGLAEGLIDDEDIESLNVLGSQAEETSDQLRVVGNYIDDVGEDYHENAAAAVQGITAGGSDSKPLKKHIFDEASIADIEPHSKTAAFVLFHNRGKFLVALRAPGGDCGETWSNIGGAQEAEDIISGDPYTSFVRTAAREVGEEVGAMPVTAKIRGHYMHEGEGFKALNFIADIDDKTADNWKFELQKDELTEIKWATLSELKSQARDLHPAFRRMLFRFYGSDGAEVMDPFEGEPGGNLKFKQAPSRKSKSPTIPTGRMSTGEPNALYGRGLFQVDHVLREDGPYNMVGNPSSDNYMRDLFTPDTIVWYDGDGVNIPSSIFGEGRIMSDLFTALFEDWSPDVPDAELETKDIKKAGDKSAIDKERPEDVERYGEDYISDSNSSDMRSPWASMSELFDADNESPGAKKLAKAKPESKTNAADQRLITYEGSGKIDKSWLDEFDLLEWYRIAEANDEPEGEDEKGPDSKAVDINLDNDADPDDVASVNYDDVKNPSDDIKRVQDRDDKPDEPEEPADEPEEGDHADVGEDGEIDEETLKRIQSKLASFISRSLQSDDPIKVFMSGNSVVMQFNRVSNKQTVQLVIASPSSVALNVGRKTDDEAVVGTAISSVNL